MTGKRLWRTVMLHNHIDRPSGVDLRRTAGSIPRALASSVLLMRLLVWLSMSPAPYGTAVMYFPATVPLAMQRRVMVVGCVPAALFAVIFESCRGSSSHRSFVPPADDVGTCRRPGRPGRLFCLLHHVMCRRLSADSMLSLNLIHLYYHCSSLIQYYCLQCDELDIVSNSTWLTITAFNKPPLQAFISAATDYF